MQSTVLILGGSGKIGSRASEAFWNAGWHVRQFNRKTDDMITAAQGVDVIVNGLNPPAYHDWERTIPAITAQVIAAAKASNATVIIPGNIYNYGDQPGILDVDTPQNARTKKGRVRIAMEQSYQASGVRTIVLRAGNFIDPDGNGDIMSMLLMREIAKGTREIVVGFGGNIDVGHSRRRRSIRGIPHVFIARVENALSNRECHIFDEKVFQT